MKLVKLKQKDSRGFTLIELLIVIIIIGILAAIAFVAYTGTTNKANKAAAQSTLSEVQSKMAEYNSDNGYYPLTISAFDTWLASSTGGNNTTLSTTFVGPSYTYTPGPTGCDNVTTDCASYTATAAGTLFGGSNPADNLSVTN